MSEKIDVSKIILFGRSLGGAVAFRFFFISFVFFIFVFSFSHFLKGAV